MAKGGVVKALQREGARKINVSIYEGQRKRFAVMNWLLQIQSLRRFKICSQHAGNPELTV
jgi:hypothetical protein